MGCNICGGATHYDIEMYGKYIGPYECDCLECFTCGTIDRSEDLGAKVPDVYFCTQCLEARKNKEVLNEFS